MNRGYVEMEKIVKLADVVIQLRELSYPASSNLKIVLFFLNCKVNNLQINSKHLCFTYYLRVTQDS